MTTFEKLRSILVENFRVREEQVKLESSIADDLGLDSLDVVELAIQVENDFGIEISDDQLEGVFTVDDLVKVIDGQLGAK